MEEAPASEMKYLADRINAYHRVLVQKESTAEERRKLYTEIFNECRILGHAWVEGRDPSYLENLDLTGFVAEEQVPLFDHEDVKPDIEELTAVIMGRPLKRQRKDFVSSAKDHVDYALLEKLGLASNASKSVAPRTQSSLMKSLQVRDITAPPTALFTPGPSREPVAQTSKVAQKRKETPMSIPKSSSAIGIRIPLETGVTYAPGSTPSALLPTTPSSPTHSNTPTRKSVRIALNGRRNGSSNGIQIANGYTRNNFTTLSSDSSRDSSPDSDSPHADGPARGGTTVSDFMQSILDPSTEPKWMSRERDTDTKKSTTTSTTTVPHLFALPPQLEGLMTRVLETKIEKDKAITRYYEAKQRALEERTLRSAKEEKHK